MRAEPVTANQFRRIALGLPEATESEHMGHPDFRIGGKVFATLASPGAGWAMVGLTPEEQAAFVGARPETFVPVKGGWGRKGATNVRLATAHAESVRDALECAWRRRAPKRLATQISCSKANVR